MNIMDACLRDMRREANLNIDSSISGRLASRRLVWHEDLQLMTIRNTDHLGNRRVYMLEWIDTHTSGNFYFGGNKIGFEEEQDIIMFKLGFKID